MQALCSTRRLHADVLGRRIIIRFCWAWLVALMASISAVVAADNSTALSSSVATSGSATSDFVALFYRLYNESQATNNNSSMLPPLELAPTDVPTEIQTRLQTYTLAFDDLPTLAQRALLWDSGYSIGDNTSSLAQIYTLCGSTMSDIALPKGEFSETGCSLQSCGSTASAAGYSYSLQCRADQLVFAAKCSSTAVGSESKLPLWTEAAIVSTDTPASSPPDLRVRRHRWTDSSSGQSVHVFAIHSDDSASNSTATTSGYCSSTSSRELAIPCVPYQRADTRWCRPEPSQLMDQWLDSLATQLLTAKRLQIDAANADHLAQRKSDSSSMKDGDGVVVDAGFHFDGTNSDLAQQFYRRFKAGDSVKPMVIESLLPQEIRQRLLDVSLEFEELPPLLQRALVWDSGYGYGDGNALAAIYVPCGSSMAEIAISRRALNRAGCVEQNCTDQTSGDSFSRMKSCTGDQIAAASLCATTDVTSPVHVSVWADGGRDDLVPDVNVLRHTWEVLNRSYLIYGIHVVRDEVAQGNCPARGAMVIPCLPYQAVVAASPGRWCRPKPGALVTSWMRLTAKDKQFNLLLLFPILLSVALAVTGLTCIIRRKTWKRLDAKLAQQHNLDHEFSHTTIASISHERGDEEFPNDEGYEFVRPGSTASSLGSDAILSASSNCSRSSIESFAATSSNWVLHTLVNNPLLASRRVDYPELRFDRVIAKGGHGEVWRCRLPNQQTVAVKRLLRIKKHHYSDLEAFTQEIALTASMDHVNIVRFLGVAWTTLPNLCMVSEFMANGDLQQYLRRDDVALEWTTEKLRIAGGIANALHYIHSREPATIHRDLKSKNVMLSSTMDAKLIDFGISRSQLGDMMTKGVGTPYWTAPEILEGQPYSEKADIYSFGIVLCELDTALSPYQDRKTSDGTPEFTPLQILQHVVSGELRPTISESCPPAVATLARACLHRDANARPTAEEALAVLQRCDPTVIVVASVEVPARFHAQQRDCHRSSLAYHL